MNATEDFSTVPKIAEDFGTFPQSSEDFTKLQSYAHRAGCFVEMVN